MTTSVGRFDPRQLALLLEPAGDDLDEARAFLQHVLEDSPVAIVVAHVEREPEPHFAVDFVTANSAALFDETPERFVEHFHTWAERLDAAGRAALTLRYFQLVAGEIDVMELEFDVDRPDGSLRSLDLTMRYDADTGRMFGYVYDVSGQRAVVDALESHEQLLNGIVRGSPDIFGVIAPDNTLAFVNPAMHDILGYEMYEAIGRPMASFIHPDDADAVATMIGGLRPGDDGSGVVRVRARHRAGHWVTLDVRARVLIGAAGEVDGVVAIARDATSQILHEQRLREAKVVAEKASQAKDEFLSRMSHELRTPLNAVLGFAQLLEMAELAQDDRESVAQIRHAGGHLLQLIDEVLDIARIEAGKLAVSLEPVSVAVAAADAVDLVAPMARLRSIAIVVTDLAGVWVQADRQRLVQVLINLLSNAIKFNRDGGEVRISAGPAEVADRCRLTVADTGPGIDPAHLARLFEPFERLDAGSQQAAGTGIGLALSRALTTQMQGTLQATSVPGAGTTFELLLPLTEAPALVVDLGDESVPPRRRGLGALRILYIEDNMANRDLIARVLERHARDDELISASQGILGLTLARARPPDVVLLDLHLPDIGGLEVLAGLRALPETASTPVVVLSADATSQQISRVMSDGADHYVSKPVVLRDLLAILDRYRGGGHPA